MNRNSLISPQKDLTNLDSRSCNLLDCGFFVSDPQSLEKSLEKLTNLIEVLVALKPEFLPIIVAAATKGLESKN